MLALLESEKTSDKLTTLDEAILTYLCRLKSFHIISESVYLKISF